MSVLVRSNSDVDQQQIDVLKTALEGVRQLALLWRHQAKPAIVADGDYTPEVVDRVLRTWTELRIAAEGGTVNYEGGAGRGDRLGIATVLADVEWATDLTLYRLRHWSSVRRIYSLQARSLDWDSQVKPLYRLRFNLDQEPPYPFGHQLCCERIARCLGWLGYEYQP